MSQLDFNPFYSRTLPHIQMTGAMLFVTYRLAGSMPQAVGRQLLDEQAALERQIAGIPNPKHRLKQLDMIHRKLFGKWDTTLDQAQSGPVWLQNPAVTPIITNSLHFLDGSRYTLDCYTVMSNHVHVVFTPLQKEDGAYEALPRIMHSLKGFTSVAANRVLGCSGPFWQHESYDRVVRDEAELNRIRRYVLNNPVKAGEVTFKPAAIEKRFDHVLFVNGIPLVVGKAKSPVNSHWSWFDGALQYGAVQTPLQHGGPWYKQGSAIFQLAHRTGGSVYGGEIEDLQAVGDTARSMLDRRVVLDMLRHFTAYATNKQGRMIKIIARYQRRTRDVADSGKHRNPQSSGARSRGYMPGLFPPRGSYPQRL